MLFCVIKKRSNGRKVKLIHKVLKSGYIKSFAEERKGNNTAHLALETLITGPEEEVSRGVSMHPAAKVSYSQ